MMSRPLPSINPSAWGVTYRHFGLFFRILRTSACFFAHNQLSPRTISSIVKATSGSSLADAGRHRKQSLRRSLQPRDPSCPSAATPFIIDNSDNAAHNNLYFPLDDTTSGTLSIVPDRRMLVHEAPASWNETETCGPAKLGRPQEAQGGRMRRWYMSRNQASVFSL
jgi:hypothetical protein